MKILVIGPPHSSKSCVVRYLQSLLPTEGCIVIEGCPDGEGMWCCSPDQEEVKRVRDKGRFSKAFVKRRIEDIRKHDNRIVLVDIGGKLRSAPEELRGKKVDVVEENNRKMFEECDAFICVSKSPELMEEWVKFASSIINIHTGKPLKCLAKIDSRITTDGVVRSQEELDAIASSMLPPEKDIMRLRICDLTRENFPRSTSKTARVCTTLAYRLLDLTRDEAKPAEKYDIDGHDLTLDIRVGKCLIVHGDQYGRKVVFPRRQTKSLKDKIMGKGEFGSGIRKMIEEKIKKNEPITIGNIHNGRAIVAICDAIKIISDELQRKQGVEEENLKFPQILICDDDPGSKNAVTRIQEEDSLMQHFTIMNDTIVCMSRIESMNAVFLNVDIYGIMNEEDKEKINSMPKVNDDKVLIISGRIPYYLLASFCLSSGAKKIYTFTPGNGFTCVKSDNEAEIGQIIKNIPGIKLEKFFDDRREGRLTGNGMDYVEEGYYSESDLEKLRILNEPDIEYCDNILKQVINHVEARRNGGKGKSRSTKSQESRNQSSSSSGTPQHILRLTRSREIMYDEIYRSRTGSGKGQTGEKRTGAKKQSRDEKQSAVSLSTIDKGVTKNNSRKRN